MKLPILASVPHAGIEVPPEVAHLNLLNRDQIVEDGDYGASRIYAIEDIVTAFVTTSIARAYVDLNRAIDDRRADGVVKTETIYRVPIYRRPLQHSVIELLLQKYYVPYHMRLSRSIGGCVLGIDCHTMAAVAPPISRDAGTARPFICLSNGSRSCSDDWVALMRDCLERAFGVDVSLNYPFKGGYIIRHHAGELPWMQLELSRADFMPLEEKRRCLLAAFRAWSRSISRQDTL